MLALDVILYVVVVINALLLIGLILIQQSKGGGFGTTFGGVGESVFGARAGNHLTRLTVILSAIFFALTLILVAISGNRSDDDRIKLKSNNAAAGVVPTQNDSAKAPAAVPVKK